MAFWSDTTLRSRLDSVIDPPNPDQVDYSGYKLKVGEEVFITSVNSKKRSTRFLKERQTIQIPSGQFALIQTEEKVTIPIDSFGLISMSSGKKFNGLINVSGFHVDPGYSGRLLFSVFNAGPNEIPIQRGEKIFMIWFAQLDQTNKASYPPNRVNDHITSNRIAPLSKSVDSLPVIAKKVDKIKTFNRWAGTIGTIFGVLIVFLATIFAPRYDSFMSRFTKMEANNTYLMDEISRQQVEITQPIVSVPSQEAIENIYAQLEDIVVTQNEALDRIDNYDVTLQTVESIEVELLRLSNNQEQYSESIESLGQIIESIATPSEPILSQPPN